MYFHFLLQSLFFLCGLVCLLAALFNWRWFFTTQNSHSFLRLYHNIRKLILRRKNMPYHFSQSHLRLLYGIFGLCLMTLAVYFYHLTRLAFTYAQ